MQPVLFPVWLLGAFWLLLERRWRLLGVAFVIFFVTMKILHAKDYYLFPIYSLVFAAGAVAVERWTLKRFWLKAAVATVVVLGTLPTVPLATWMLSPDQYLIYQAALGFKPSKAEVHMQSLWPQPAADQFGWPQLVGEVAEIYTSIPPDQRAKTGIWAGNYGEAGAINLGGRVTACRPPTPAIRTTGTGVRRRSNTKTSSSSSGASTTSATTALELRCQGCCLGRRVCGPHFALGFTFDGFRASSRPSEVGPKRAYGKRDGRHQDSFCRHTEIIKPLRLVRLTNQDSE